MPIYEFVCGDCGKSFDKLCSMNHDLSTIRCEFCQSSGIRKKMSGFATTSNRDTLTLGEGSGGSSCSSCSSSSCSSCNH